jgi:hypothetical protein
MNRLYVSGLAFVLALCVILAVVTALVLLSVLWLSPS